MRPYGGAMGSYVVAMRPDVVATSSSSDLAVWPRKPMVTSWPIMGPPLDSIAPLWGSHLILRGCSGMLCDSDTVLRSHLGILWGCYATTAGAMASPWWSDVELCGGYAAVSAVTS